MSDALQPDIPQAENQPGHNVNTRKHHTENAHAARNAGILPGLLLTFRIEANRFHDDIIGLIFNVTRKIIFHGVQSTGKP